MENREFDRLDELIKTKDYDLLTNEEQLFVTEQIGSQQAYAKLRSLVIEAQRSESIAVAPTVKSNLIGKFKSKHRKPAFFWLSYSCLLYTSDAADD